MLVTNYLVAFIRKPCVKGEQYPRRPVVLHHPPLFGDAYVSRLRCRISRRSTPPHSRVIESSVSAYSGHCRRIGHISPSSRCLPVVGSRPRTKSSNPRTRQARREVRRFHDPYSRLKTPSFSGQSLVVREPRKRGAEGRDAEVPPDPSARPTSSFGPPNRHWGVEVKRHGPRHRARQPLVSRHVTKAGYHVPT